MINIQNPKLTLKSTLQQIPMIYPGRKLRSFSNQLPNLNPTNIRLPQLQYVISPLAPLVEQEYNNSQIDSFYVTQSRKLNDSSMNDISSQFDHANSKGSKKKVKWTQQTQPDLHATLKPQPQQLIGTQAFSSVFKVEIPEIQKVFSLKVKQLSFEHREREYLILRQRFFGQQSHPNFIQLQHYFTSQSDDGQRYMNLVTDYIPMNLQQFFNSYKNKQKTIPKIIVKLFAFQLFRAVAYMHEHHIMHRDLNPENILVDTDTLQLKICDFGQAKFSQKRETSNIEVGKRTYRAPELLLGAKDYNYSMDLWALGCIFVELVTLQSLFMGPSKEDVFSEIIKQLGTPTTTDLVQLGGQIVDLKLPMMLKPPWTVRLKQAESGMIEIISQLIQYQPQKRGEAFDYMTHSYFNELRKPSIKINGRNLPKIFDFTYEELKLPRYESSIYKILPK